MKKIFFSSLFIVFLSACSSTYTSYRVSLDSVECPTDTKIQYVEKRIILVARKNGISTNRYEDENIKIAWNYGDNQIDFTLTNKSDFAIILPWDKMSYVNELGNAMRVVHSGVLYAYRNEPQTETIIPQNATFKDFLIPSENIHTLGSDYGGFGEKRLLPEYFSQEEANNSPLLGKKVRVFFPIIIQDVQNEYIFEFSIDEVVVNELY